MKNSTKKTIKYHNEAELKGPTEEKSNKNMFCKENKIK